MKKFVLPIFLCLCLALSACGRVSAPEGSLTLWYAQDDPAAPLVEAAATTYNADSKSGFALLLRAFETEEALAAALETNRPDLLLCSHTRAFALAERGMLTALSGVDADFAPWLEEQFADAGVGSGVFPLGAQVTLLYGAETGGGAAALCRQAAEYGSERRQPSLCVDSLAGLLCQLMLDGGDELRLNNGQEIFSAGYQDAYNEIAEAVFSGGLLWDEHGGAALVQAGAVPAALVDSSKLSGTEGDAASVCLPETNGMRVGALRCLAVLSAPGKQSAAVVSFLRWLCEGERLGGLALHCGLVPVSAAAGGGSVLSEVLLAVAGEGALRLPDSGEWDNLEARLRWEMSFLPRGG